MVHGQCKVHEWNYSFNCNKQIKRYTNYKMEPWVYDVCVIGGGMIGSAAARHATEILGPGKVVLIGPVETENGNDTDIFGCHYDEGRVTRILDPDPVWGLLAMRSIDEYRNIEKISGIQFYKEAGFLALGSGETLLDYFTSVNKVANELGVPVQNFCSSEIKEAFNIIVPDHISGVFTRKNAGYISPRNMVMAQQKAAIVTGCTVIRDIAKCVRKTTNDMTIITDKGNVIRSKRVLVATGAFSQFRDLLPWQLDLKIRSQFVVKVAISEDNATFLGRMPSVIIKTALLPAYILPPIRYPNGVYYLKIGHGRQQERTFTTPTEITAWYRAKEKGPTEQEIKKMYDILLSILPKEVKPLYREVGTCATSLTPTGKPYVSMVTEDIGVALGGCGYAAKSSDEIGRMAARMISKGHWDYDLPASLFKCQFRNGNSRL